MDNIIRNPVTSVTVGLDLSLSASGFCLKEGGVIKIDTIKTTPASAENELARLKLIANEVLFRIPANVSMICIEDFFTPSNSAQIGAAIKLVMLGTTVRLALYDKGYPFYIVAPGQLKKFITGSGAAQKSMIVREVYKKYGIDTKDDNQADACVLAHLAEAMFSNPTDLPKYQAEVVSKVLADRPRFNIKPPV